MLFKLFATSRSRTLRSPLGATSFSFPLAARGLTVFALGSWNPGNAGGDSSANRAAQRENAGARQGRAGEGGVQVPPGLAGSSRSSIEPSALEPWSLFPDLVPGDWEGRVPAPSWRVRREFGWSEKEVRVSGIYRFLQRNYKFLGPPSSSNPVVFCTVCVPALIYLENTFPFLKPGAGEGGAACGARVRRGTPEAVRCAGDSRRCGRGRLRL